MHPNMAATNPIDFYQSKHDRIIKLGVFSYEYDILIGPFHIFIIFFVRSYLDFLHHSTFANLCNETIFQRYLACIPNVLFVGCLHLHLLEP